MSFEHTFTEPGSHQVTFVATSGDHCLHPYGGRATFTITFGSGLPAGTLVEGYGPT